MKTNQSRVLSLAFALALAAVALAPLPVDAFPCGRDPYDDVWVYYSDATYTTVVGRCENDCGVCQGCWGIQTQYFRVTTSRNC